jgi:hypothetical protein
MHCALCPRLAPCSLPLPLCALRPTTRLQKYPRLITLPVTPPSLSGPACAPTQPRVHCRSSVAYPPPRPPPTAEPPNPSASTPAKQPPHPPHRPRPSAANPPRPAQARAHRSGGLSALAGVSTRRRRLWQTSLRHLRANESASRSTSSRTMTGSTEAPVSARASSQVYVSSPPNLHMPPLHVLRHCLRAPSLPLLAR